jgi:hypothetical protein
VVPGALVTVLGVVYVHRKTRDGGDLYLTSFGLRHAALLDIDNWYDRPWFEQKRVRLFGTSSVFRVPTKPVDGRSIELVVKNCRVGEDVPVDTRTLLEFINAEFNSPWEEFGLVFEMRDSKLGPPSLAIRTQEPLAIYVPPETMQIWQSGRSVDKINRIQARHPGIDIDILRQYKLVYGWIEGQDVVQTLESLGFTGSELNRRLKPLTEKAMADLDSKGYVVADMKPSHIIIGDEQLDGLRSGGTPSECAARLEALLQTGNYSIVDYELLLRTPDHEEAFLEKRRHHYLDDQRDRLIAAPLPEFLKPVEILGVPYVFGHAESTGGRLWVVGRNGRLFDYFLPERWRKTHAFKLSENADIYYTYTKDHVHVVWKISRVGERPQLHPEDPRAESLLAHGYNSPFEEAAIAHDLSQKGVGTVYVRAIYMTGSSKVEISSDTRRYATHRHLADPEGTPVLHGDHNYITVRGYFNGSDSWVSRQTGQLCRPMNLVQALSRGLIDARRFRRIFDEFLLRLSDVGYDGSLLDHNDLLLALTPDGALLTDDEGKLDVRLSNFEFVRRQNAPQPATLPPPGVRLR